MLRSSRVIPPGVVALPTDVVRNRIAIAATAVGASISLVALLARVSPGSVTVPLSLGIAIALLVVPFPAADRWLAFGLVGSLPLFPSIGLPNVPLAAGVIAIALARLWFQPRGLGLRSRSIGVLAGLWITLAIGLAFSHWPAPGIWLRPLAIIVIGVAASGLGWLVWSDEERRDRWLDGLAIGVVVAAASSIVVFALQLIAPVTSVVDGVVGVMGYFRGDLAAAKFADQNNWIIYGNDLTLRAVTPMFPAPNNLGGYLGVVLPLVLARWYVAPPGRWRRLAAVATWLGILAALLTISRSTWVAGAAAVGCTVFVMIAKPAFRHLVVADRKRLARAGACGVLALATGAIGIFVVGQNGVENRLVHPLEDPSVQGRFDIGEAAVNALSREVLRGVGLGNWTATIAEGEYIHNVYLEYAVAVGLFGALWAVLLIAIPAVAGLIAAIRGVGGQAILGLALLGGAVFNGVQFLFDDNLMGPQYAWLTFWAIGGSVALAAGVLRGRPTGTDDGR